MCSVGDPAIDNVVCFSLRARGFSGFFKLWKSVLGKKFTFFMLSCGQPSFAVSTFLRLVCFASGSLPYSALYTLEFTIMIIWNRLTTVYHT